MSSAYLEFGRPSITLGRKGLRTITRLGWCDSINTQPQNIGNIVLSPGQRDTASQETSVAPSASDTAPSPMQNYRYFGAFLTGQKIAATSRDGARALISRTFEELNDGTIDLTALIYQGTLTKASNPTYGGILFGPDPSNSNAPTWPPPQPPTPSAPWSVQASSYTIAAGSPPPPNAFPPSGYTYTRAGLAVPAFAARSFQQVMPFRFPGLYGTFPPVSRHVTATIIEYFFLANPANGILGYEPLRWCQLSTTYTPNGGFVSAPVLQYFPGYLSGGYGSVASGSDLTYNGIACSTIVVSSTSNPVNYPFYGYQMVQSAQDFYGEGGILFMRRDVYVNFKDYT